MLAYWFVLFAFAFRFLPETLGFTPVAASLLFFGARGERRRMWIPLVLMAASDVLLSTFRYAYPLTWDLLVTWAWYAAILWLGTKLRHNARPFRVIAAALVSSVSFFLVSNFMVWMTGTMYPKTLSGLTVCYSMGLPFFRRGLESDLLFTSVMFATPALVDYFSGASKSDPAAAA
jgi:uncharacterized protein DUF6580